MSAPSPELVFLLSPKSLPRTKGLGRVVLLDIAFASGQSYFSRTRPFIRAVNHNLAAWIDHHSHPAWADYADDPRFVLRGKREAPGCPELVTPELVKHVGDVDRLLAHADFDGCISAAKYLRGGESPYPDADADARAVDAPGRGFVCSPTGNRLALALDQARCTLRAGSYLAFLDRVAKALVDEHEPAELRIELDRLAEQQRVHLEALEPLLADAKRPHPDLLLLELDAPLAATDRKALLRQLEERARIAVVADGGRVTAATFEDDRFDLSKLPGFEGGPGLAWGATSSQMILAQLAQWLTATPPQP